jgi:hypothetical protein
MKIMDSRPGPSSVATTVSSGVGGDLSGSLPQPTVSGITDAAIIGTPTPGAALVALTSNTIGWLSASERGDHAHAVGEMQIANGSEATFYTANYFESSTLAVYVNGTRQSVTEGASLDVYTLSGTPPVGARLQVDYLARMT